MLTFVRTHDLNGCCSFFAVFPLVHTHLSHVFLHQLRADDSDEAGVRPVSHSAGAQGLSCAGGAEQQHAFWGLNAQIDKPLGLMRRGETG